MNPKVYQIQLRNAAQRAARLIAEYGIFRAEDIRLEDIAWDLGAEVVIGGLGGAAARLTLHNGRARIRVREDASAGRQRFSIAHELGHFLLHRDRMERPCQDADFRAYRDAGGRRMETEANVFASELLIPASIAVRECNLDEVSMATVKAMADRFQTSLTAAAVRLVGLSTDACALALSTRTAISWTIPSDALALPLTTGRPDRESLTHRLFEEGSDMGRTTVPATAWFPSARHDRVLVEDARLLKAYGQVLALLHAPWAARRDR